MHGTGGHWTTNFVRRVSYFRAKFVAVVTDWGTITHAITVTIFLNFFCWHDPTEFSELQQYPL